MQLDLVKGVEVSEEIPALGVEGVTHAFGARKALDDVSLTVPRGSFTALLGPNGAGKTTLFSLVTRLYDNRTGSIRVLGFDVRRQPAAALTRLGVVFQARTLDLELSVTQNLALPRRAARRRLCRRAQAGARGAGAGRAHRPRRRTRCATSPAARCAASRSPAR